MSDEVKNTEEVKDASMTASPSDIAPAAEVDIMVRGSLGGDNAAPDARGGRG
jgi:hypothetical protein